MIHRPGSVFDHDVLISFWDRSEDVLPWELQVESYWRLEAFCVSIDSLVSYGPVARMGVQAKPAAQRPACHSLLHHSAHRDVHDGIS